MLYFTSDEHYGHKNVIKYCNRPFADTEEMDYYLITKHNELVKGNDTVIHVGDFTLMGLNPALEYISKLNGSHIFLQGSHDYWLEKSNLPLIQIWEKKVHDVYLVACHYAMRTWPRSHYNSWQLFGHSHGNLNGIGKQYDVGVDNNDFTPVSFEKLKKIIDSLPDNFNCVKKLL